MENIKAEIWKKNNLEFFAYGLAIILILIVNFQFNLIGSRFYSQDFIWNDYVYAEKLRYLKASIEEKNFFSVINFSESFGRNYIVDLKVRNFILDPALYLSFFFNEFVAITIKIVIFQFIAFHFFYQQLKQKYNDVLLNVIFAYFFIFNLTFLSHEVSLTTNTYLLIAPIYFYAKNFIKEKKIQSLIFFSFFSFLFLGNVDLNIFFISFFIVIAFLNFDLKNLFSKQHVLIVLFFLTQCLILFSLSVIEYINNYDYHTASPKFNLVYFYQIFRILLSTFHPTTFGPVSLFYLPFLFIFLLKDTENLKKVFLLYFFGILFFVIPYFASLVGFNSPAVIRYHLFFVGFFSYILSIDSFYKNKFLLYSNIKNFFDNKLLVINSIIFFILVVIFSTNKYLGLIISLLLFLFYLLIFFEKKYIYKRTSLILINIFIVLYIFLGQQGGLPKNDLKIVNKKISDQIKISSQCIKDIVQNQSVAFIVNTNNFKFSPGRDDYIMSLIESPSQIAGRTFFQWRHSNNNKISLIYNELGAKGTDDVNYFPILDQNIKPNIFEKNKELKNKYIATNFLFNDSNIKLLTICDNFLKISKDSIFSLFNGNVFLKKIYLYEIIKFTKDKYDFSYNLSKITINNYDIKNQHFFIPIIFSEYLFIKNLKKNEYKIIPDEQGVEIILSNNINKDILVLSSYSNKLIFPYIINFIFCIIYCLFIFFIYKKKNI